MSKTVIKIEKLSKQYRLGMIGTGTLSHDLNRWVHKIRGKPDPYSRIGQPNVLSQSSVPEDRDYVWALKDVDLDIQQGEILGIIGKNGAGKSTLLKILSQVTGPTSGTIKVKGRIASLLEVGTGFHPEMTGRENIFMNGTIMGMTRHEIRRKLDDIVDFAGVSKYLDTPAKRYSSGMKVRLGFAVAAFLEPENLIVDEVLAVGDAEFQKRALGRIQDVSKNDGRTVLFVSHNMASVQTICRKGIVLDNGRKIFDGNIEDAIQNHLATSLDVKLTQSWTFDKAPGNSSIRINSIVVRPKNKSQALPIYVHDDFDIEIKYWNLNNNNNIDITLRFYSEQNILLFVTGSGSDTNWHGKRFPSALFSSFVTIKGHFLNAGKYRVEILFGHSARIAICHLEDLISFEILHSAIGRAENSNRAPGLFRPLFKWETNLIQEGEVK